MQVTHGSSCCHSYFFFIGVGSSLFGNKGQTAFGGTSFNQPQSSATTGLFGGTSTNTAGSLFGGTSSGSIFGQQPAGQCKLEILINIVILKFIAVDCSKLDLLLSSL